MFQSLSNQFYASMIVCDSSPMWLMPHQECPDADSCTVTCIISKNLISAIIHMLYCADLQNGFSILFSNVIGVANVADAEGCTVICIIDSVKTLFLK